MTRAKPKKQTGSESPSEAESQSPEFSAFEKLVKRVVNVPKTEIDKREAEYQRTRKGG